MKYNCSDCMGTGESFPAVLCKRCNGTGEVDVKFDDLFVYETPDEVASAVTHGDINDFDLVDLVISEIKPSVREYIKPDAEWVLWLRDYRNSNYRIPNGVVDAMIEYLKEMGGDEN